MRSGMLWCSFMRAVLCHRCCTVVWGAVGSGGVVWCRLGQCWVWSVWAEGCVGAVCDVVETRLWLWVWCGMVCGVVGWRSCWCWCLVLVMAFVLLLV